MALALLGSLTPEHMKQLGQMLEQDWKDRPEWGDMAIAILKGENMRLGMGWWKPTAKRYEWDWIAGRFDSDKDSKVSREEFQSMLASVPGRVPSDQEKPKNNGATDDSTRESPPKGKPLTYELMFDRLDRDLSGDLSVADFDWSDQRAMSPAAMQARMTEMLFYRLDTDSNGRVTTEELAEFFVRSDREALGFLTPEDFRTGFDDPESRRPAATGQKGPSSAQMIQMFLTGQLGTFEAGPGLGDVAPDFTLPTHDGSTSISLSASRGKRPVVLIFGSFT